ncbi:accessory gene regulator B family protein [Chengkuizengella sp. SCS-71B]|uniref:accessory gene regulator B family protein n=1 Tax=Chengkuizengella sp. SCS-71B TaxID=3115290 RepID=UPI0032C232CC
MIERMSAKIANKINHYDSSSDVEVMEYALKILLNLFSVVLICFIVGIITNQLKEIFLAFFSFALLRAFSGGFHFKSLVVCSIISSCVFIFISFISINLMVTQLLNIVSLFIVWFRAPVNVHINTQIPRQILRYFKFVSIIIVAINLFVGSSIFALSYMIQALSLLTKRL